MKEGLISFKTAKLIKKKKFNIPTFYYYKVEGDIGKNSITLRSNVQMNVWADTQEKWSAPTQSLLQKWLREVHNLHIDMYRNALGFQCNLDKAGCGTHIQLVIEDTECTYEEALEKGLEAALKLIKIN